MTIEIQRSTPHKGNVTVSRYDSEKTGIYDAQRIIVPSHVAYYSWDWLCKFNQGRDWAMTYPYAPPVSRGCAFWTGYRYQAMRSPEVKPPDDGVFITDEQEIAATLEFIPLRYRWAKWTGFSGPEDVTAIIATVNDGEFDQVWATGSSRPWDIYATWEPLPVRL